MYCSTVWPSIRGQHGDAHKTQKGDLIGSSQILTLSDLGTAKTNLSINTIIE
jgi:hypothetical protein